MEIDLPPWVVRSFRDEDLESLVRYADNPRVAENLRDQFPHPYRYEDGRAWLKWASGQAQETIFAIANEAEVIGGIGLILQDDVHRRSAEIGYWLGEPFWNLGIASRAVDAIVDWGFANLDLNRIYAMVFETNPASVRVLEKTGFTLEGTLRQSVTKKDRSLDQSVYAILQGEAAGSNALPTRGPNGVPDGLPTGEKK